MSAVDIGSGAAVVAEASRGGLVESVHLGHVVVLAPDGSRKLALGRPDATLWPRSSLKPVQAVAMLRAGLDVDDEALALASASHNGEPGHLERVEKILADHGLTVADLRNTPDWPLDPDAAYRWRSAGHGAASVTQNCSGKHAGMLATCVAAGWPSAGYLVVDHPLQRAIHDEVEALTGEEVHHVTVDGCGAPLLSTTLTGLARAFGRIARAPHDEPSGAPARVARAMNAHPWLVGGTGREATAFMTAVPGLVAKDGAEGVYAAGLPDGTGVAFKVLDGSSRPRPALLAAALAVAGLPWDVVEPLGRTPVLGHGAPVGDVRATFGPAA